MTQARWRAALRRVTAAGWLQALGVLAAVVATLIGQIALWSWVVEDAAISFAYARNLAEGWGLVRFPGDERVEGYSNPLWVLLMAAFELGGVDGFASSKGMALALGAGAVPLAWAVARRAGAGPGAAVAAAWLLATDAQFVIWAASGLENALFCALLALGLHRTLVEDERGGFPWAAACFLGVAVTRPEGLAYAAIGGGWALVLELAGARRWSRIFAWLGLFWGPFAIYHAVRYDYFALPFPATFYAKVGDVEPAPFAWNARSWTYVRGYCEELGRGWFLPVMIAGALGMRGWRGWVVALASVWLGGVLLYPGVEPLIGWGLVPKGLATPDWWIRFRVASLAGVALLVPVLGIGAEGWRARGLLWATALFALGFSVYSTGDWMRGYRWFSLASVPVAVLLAVGIGEIAAWIGRIGRQRFEWRAVGAGVGLALAVAAVAPQVAYQARYVPETSPWSVDKRVQHYRWALQKLHVERADILDHDMGAMLFWGGDLGIVRDSRGLVDVAFALHERKPAFVKEYAWEEYPFDLAHAHASTQPVVKSQGAAWRDGYIEFPGYGVNNFHNGNYVRKGLLVGRTWDLGTSRSARFADGVVLHGVDVPAPEVSPGSSLYLELGLSTRPRPDAPIRLLMLLVPTGPGAEGRRTEVFDLPLGLDDWYPVTEWQAGEIFQGRLSVPLPPRLALGTWDLGFAVIGPDGVLPAEDVGPDGVIPEVPAFARGEVRFPGQVVLVDKERMGQEAHDDVKRAITAANRLRCDEGEAWWRKARAHRIRSVDWTASVRPGVADALASCFALRAERESGDAAVASMRRALSWNRVHPTALRVGSDLGGRLFADGLALRAAGDVEGAFRAFRDSVAVDPSRSWSRRYTEELRAERLGLGWN